MEITAEISSYDSNVRSTYKEIKEFIESHEIPKVASWDKVSSRKGLYDSLFEVYQSLHGCLFAHILLTIQFRPYKCLNLLVLLSLNTNKFALFSTYRDW